MRVTIPKKSDHEGYSGNLVTLEISNNCPECGGVRGNPYRVTSWDGSRRLHCDGWVNPCGHVDKYHKVRQEGRKVAFKPVEDWPADPF